MSSFPTRLLTAHPADCLLFLICVFLQYSGATFNNSCCCCCSWEPQDYGRPWKTSLNCLLTKQTFPCCVFCAESQDHVVQTCNGLGAPKTTAEPHPRVSPGMFACSSDLDLQDDVRSLDIWNFVISHRLEKKVLHSDRKSLGSESIIVIKSVSPKERA